MKIGRVVKAIVTKGCRQLEVYIGSKVDKRTGTEAMPAGMDSVPIAEMDAVYADATTSGNEVIIGYVNRRQLAKAGEWRSYSQDGDGGQLFQLWMKADGKLYMGHATNTAAYTEYMVKHTALNTALQNQNTLIMTNLTNIAAVLNGIVPGSILLTPVTVNITAAKTEKIKIEP